MRVDITLENTSRLTEYIEKTLEKSSAPMSVIMKMNIALDEIYSNIVKFSGASYAIVNCYVQDGIAFLSFEDDGIAYNPLSKKDADITLSAEEREPGGLGILMVKKSMDNMEYSYENNKNILVLSKKL